jgi:hypothetical protein
MLGLVTNYSAREQNYAKILVFRGIKGAEVTDNNLCRALRHTAQVKGFTAIGLLTQL